MSIRETSLPDDVRGPVCTDDRDPFAAERCAVAGRRIKSVYVLLVILMLAGTSMLLRPVLMNRQEIIAESERLSLHEGVMPAVRGRITGHDGTVVAWSEIKIDLYCTTSDPVKRSRYTAGAASLVAGISDNGAENPLRTELTPAEYESLKPLLAQTTELRAVSRNVRKYHGDWQELAGSVAPGEDGMWVGISGWEAEYEDVLSGVPGRFEVNRDPQGHWMRPTFRITLAPIQGCDVIVTLPENTVQDSEIKPL